MPPAASRPSARCSKPERYWVWLMVGGLLLAFAITVFMGWK
jgi:hypothetical protein